MSPNKRPLSDRQLRALLKGLREDVAAPPDFSRGVLQRLQAQGLISGPAPLAGPSWAQRLGAWFSPARIGLGLSAAAALALVLLNPQAQAPAPQAVAPEPTAQAPQAAKPSRKAARPVVVAQAAPVQSLAAEVQSEAAPVQGRSDAAVSVAPVQAADVSAKPTMVAFKPEPPADARPLVANSEVRNNVFRASRGEAALILFRVAQAGRVRVEIHDRLGRLVTVLADRDFGTGEHSLGWTGSADEGGTAASGIYQLRILAPGYTESHKVLLAK